MMGGEREMCPQTVKAIGITGWKNSGKTTLSARLISEFTRRGLGVSAVKHSHHDVIVDAEGTDSARLAAAGARQVAVVSPLRWGIVGDFTREEPEPALNAVMAALAPVDLIVVEGFKRAPIRKIEVRRKAACSQEALAQSDPLVVAIAADHEVADARCPVFGLDDVASLADFILATTEFRQPEVRP